MQCVNFKLTIFIPIFRHADREVVLEHVKSHYRDDGTPQERQQSAANNNNTHATSTSSQMDLAPPPLPIQMPFQIMNNLLNGHGIATSTNTTSNSSSTTNVHNRNNLLTTLGGGVVNQMQATSNSNATTSQLQTLNFNPQNTLTTPTTSTLDVGIKNNNGLQDMNSSSSSLKGSFRCGHCGQISNWKHVIQVFTNNMISPFSNFHIIFYL